MEQGTWSVTKTYQGCWDEHEWFLVSWYWSNCEFLFCYLKLILFFFFSLIRPVILHSLRWTQIVVRKGTESSQNLETSVAGIDWTFNSWGGMPSNLHLLCWSWILCFCPVRVFCCCHIISKLGVGSSNLIRVNSLLWLWGVLPLAVLLILSINVLRHCYECYLGIQLYNNLTVVVIFRNYLFTGYSEVCTLYMKYFVVRLEPVLKFLHIFPARGWVVWSTSTPEPWLSQLSWLLIAK